MGTANRPASEGLTGHGGPAAESLADRGEPAAAGVPESTERVATPDGAEGARGGADEQAPDEPGLDEPGQAEPGLDEPGLDEPGLDEPGLDEPGLDEPGQAVDEAPAAVDDGTLAGRHRTPPWAKICIGVGALLMVSSGGTLLAAEVLSERYESSVTRDVLLAPDARDVGAGGSTITGPLNYLLIGSDYRTRSPADGQRSDTIIVVHVPATLDRAYLVSIPRDLLTQIPPYPPTGFPGGETKINSAYQHGGGGRGGTQLLSMTLSQLLGTRFNGAAIVNFEGFRKAVDVLGGVYLCVDRAVASNHMGMAADGRILELWADEEGRIQGLPPGASPYVFEQGCRRMDGRLALDYARIRYGLPAGDYDRQRHQQQFIKAMFAEAIKDGVVTNPVKLDEFLRAVGSTLTVDTGETGLADLIFGLRNVTPSTFVGVKVPSFPRTIDGVSYVLADPLATSLFLAIRQDTMDSWVAENPAWVNRL